MPSSTRALLRALLAGAAVGAPLAAHAAEESPPTVSGVVVEGDRRDPAAPIAAADIDAATIEQTINAVTVEDTLKYLPSLVVRRRHIGDTQAPIATRTSGVGASARSLIYADGVLLSALIGNNNSNASPRWGMVTPDEVARIDVHYGPFSAAYPGNSIGAVVEIITRKPVALEGEVTAGASSQHFSQYGTRNDYPTYQLGGSVGDRRGPVWWRASLSHLDSRSQPLSFVTVRRSVGGSTAGQPASGASTDLSRSGQPIMVLGAGGLEHQAQDNAKLKLGWDITPQIEVTYLLGYFGQDDGAGVQSYLRDAAGAPIYAGQINVDKQNYSVAPGAFASGLYRLKEAHWMHALTLAGEPSERLSWRATASLYDYGTDEQRSPTALPGGLAGGAGSILDLSGTGWRTFDAELSWRPEGGRHAVRGGVHADGYELASHRYATADWQTGAPAALSATSAGKTRTLAAWAEDRIALATTLHLTLGARLEQWRAFHGFNGSLSPVLSVQQPALSATRASPKAVLAWTPDQAWRATASFGVAYRFPTVGELYQAVSTGPALFAPDPSLAPERALSGELAIERSFRGGRARLSLFSEDIADALLSQAGSAPGSSTPVTFVQNVDKVRSRGAELYVEAVDVLTPGFDLSGSATYVASETVRDVAFPAAAGKRTPQLPRLRWTAVASWRANRRLTLTAAARYSDRSYATLDNSDPITHTYQGFDGYLVVDLRAAWRLNDHWSAAVGVDNAGDRSYFLFHPFPQRSVLAEIKYVY